MYIAHELAYILIHFINSHYELIWCISYYEIVCIMNSRYDDAYDFILYFAPAEGNPYLNDLLGHLRQARNVNTNGRVLVGLSRERRGPHPGGAPRGQRVRCGPCVAAVSEGEWQQIWWLARSNPNSCEQVSKRLVAYIKALLVLCPYGRASDPRIAAITDAHFNTALASPNILPDVEFKAYMERKAGEFFEAYGFVAREGKSGGSGEGQHISLQS
jgi:hypothetical protein